MKLGHRRFHDRELRNILRAPFEVRHWRALVSLLGVLDPGPEALRRYVTQGGTYPWAVRIKTPSGAVRVTLYSRHDLLTVNEIFCRHDYGVQRPELVLDVGANIGLAALYWLTRNPRCTVWCYEPHPGNVAKLHGTLRGFEGRYYLVEAAVGSVAGQGRFTYDNSGRYGRLSTDDQLGGELQVEIVSLAHELRRVEERERRRPDLVKLDTEAGEEELLALVPPDIPVIWEDSIGRVRRDRPR